MSPSSTHSRNESLDGSTSSSSSPIIQKLMGLPGVAALRGRKSSSNLHHSSSTPISSEGSTSTQSAARRPRSLNRKRSGSVSCPNVIRPDASDMSELHHLVESGKTSPPSRSSSLGLLVPSDFAPSKSSPVKETSKSTGVIDRSSSAEQSIDSGPSFLDSTSVDSTGQGSPITTDTEVSTRSRSNTTFSDRRASAWDASLTPRVLASHLGLENSDIEGAGNGETAKISHEALVAAAAKHFSVRGGPEDWDARLIGALGKLENGDQITFKTKDGELCQRFSVRPNSGWDAGLKNVDLRNLGTTGKEGLSARMSSHGIKPEELRFSTRSPGGWDASILVEDKDGKIRFSERAPPGWDASVLFALERNDPRFSVRAPEDWDAKICPASVPTSEDGGEVDSQRLRSSTLFSNRPLSAWDAHLTQSIPIIVPTASSGDDDNDEDDEDGNDEATDVSLHPSVTDSLCIPARANKRHQIFSVRGDLAEWDAGLAAELRSKDLTCTTPTQEQPNKV